MLEELDYIEENYVGKTPREATGSGSAYSMHPADLGTDSIELEKAYHDRGGERRRPGRHRRRPAEGRRQATTGSASVAARRSPPRGSRPFPTPGIASPAGLKSEKSA